MPRAFSFHVVPDPDALAKEAAGWLVDRLAQTPGATLLLATGQTPLATYAEVSTRVRKNRHLIEGVRVFALDEYCGLAADHPRSFRDILQRSVGTPWGLPLSALHAPDGLAGDPEQEANRYEASLAGVGYADIAVLGVGTNGHLAFNEPGTDFGSASHVATLAEETRRANAHAFRGDPSAVPERAITVGLATIIRSRTILVLAQGASKREALRQLDTWQPSSAWPITALQSHPRVHVIADTDAWWRG